jgi:ubiquinone/menaquinone biosynthesis C-methylase UbiE
MQKTLNNLHKASTKYLNAISSHLDEKTRYIASAIADNRIPLIGGKVRILEIGIGGGQTMRVLKDQFGEKIDITGIDILPEIVEKANKSGIKSVLANVCDLSFDDASFSCVNAASVFHEVSSYGHIRRESMIYGIEAVKLALKEIKRVLCSEGMLFYRDVMAPDKHARKKVAYEKISWKFFIDHFLPDFVDSGPAFYKDDCVLKKNETNYLIIGDSSLHREIQKHYLLGL